MYMGIYSSSQLNDLQLNVSDSAPQIQISSLQNQDSLPPEIAISKKTLYGAILHLLQISH